MKTVKRHIRQVNDGATVAIKCDCTVHITEEMIKVWIDDAPVGERRTRGQAIKYLALCTYVNGAIFNPVIVGVHKFTREEIYYK